MLTRRNRDILPQKTEPAAFAAKAKDLGALRDAVVDAASVSAGLWITYLFALFYFAIAAGAVTHRDLLLESPVKLPFLNVELPLKAFFILGPLVFLILVDGLPGRRIILDRPAHAFDRLGCTYPPAGDWDGVRKNEVTGSNSYSKMVARYRHDLLDVHAAWPATVKD
jgi:hypothetical protein